MAPYSACPRRPETRNETETIRIYYYAYCCTPIALLLCRGVEKHAILSAWAKDYGLLAIWDDLRRRRSGRSGCGKVGRSESLHPLRRIQRRCLGGIVVCGRRRGWGGGAILHGLHGLSHLQKVAELVIPTRLLCRRLPVTGRGIAAGFRRSDAHLPFSVAAATASLWACIATNLGLVGFRLL